MSNRILKVVFENQRLDPLQAEVRVHVRPDLLTPTTEIRGRLMGPSCPYSSTLEIAHPLTVQMTDPSEGTIVCRVVIPEASLWDPVSPFLYSGTIELWQDGQRCSRVQASHGLRKLALNQKGLRINGKPFSLRARSVAQLSPEEAAVLRREGVNVLVAPLRPESLGVWEVADRFGFLAVGEVGADFEPLALLGPEINCRPSCLGFLLDENLLPEKEESTGPFPSALVGLRLPRPSGRALPAWVDFVVAVGDDAEGPADCSRPLLFHLPSD